MLIEPATTRLRKPSAAELVRSCLGLNAGQLLAADPTVRAGRDPEGIHQMRVGARRLRAELALLSPALKRSPTEHLRDELRWLGRSLGAIRDLDTLAGRLAVPDGVEGALELTEEISAMLSTMRTVAVTETRSTLASKRYRRLLSELTAAVVDPPLRKIAVVPARGLLTPSLHRATESLVHSIDALPGSPAPEQLHLVRILTKRLRYGAVTAAAFDGDAALHAAAALGKVQDALGEMRDAGRAHFLIETLDTEVRTEPVRDAMAARCEAEIERHRQSWSACWPEARASLSNLGWLPG